MCPTMAYNYLLTDKTFAYQLNINPKSEGNRINAEKITQMSTTPTWIEIKSEDDLPKESGYYWVINSFDDIFIEDFSPKDIIDRDIWLDHRTHYQPIYKPPPPNKLH